jgi:hypothetical protein
MRSSAARSASIFRWVAAGGAIAVAVAVGLRVCWSPVSPENAPAGAPEEGLARAAVEPDPPAPTEAAPAPPDPDLEGLVLQSGATLEIARASLSSDEPVVVNLLLPEPSQTSEPLAVRVLAFDGRILETRGALHEADRRSARFELQADWLSPGRYLIEMKTTERTHFPLRRYALEVR